MHGRVQREGGESDRRKRSRRKRRKRRRRRRRRPRRLRRWSSVQHMRSVPASVTTTTRTVPVKGDSAIVSISSDSFRKDGRTISVGDCALFKPPQDSPPFIGIIRRLSYSKEKNLQLRVNWLYRPAELKLGKGILRDAAPNEIFYSFHTDEIPAASLLHPCKVAFLPKGVELPSGISSFVCRQVYDIANKCLWWLTDQDYTNDRQEEVDQLLYKTKIEMHATIQPGGRSPKPINGPTSTSQLRPGSDSVQNMSSFTSQVKGKKRERGDQGSDPVKRERSMKIDEGDSGQSGTENSLKSEIAKISEKGGLVDSEEVEKLVHLMQPDKAEKKMDLACRSMLAGVIAATDKVDCLHRFVQLRGLPVLNEWLQDVHKGKIGNSSSSKDGDKSVEEFLLVLLRALDKLPVNIQALQMCNIGRSVNHLRLHKNSEIQKKARSLVDTWKKRVEAEMNIRDAKSGSNHTISSPSNASHPETNGGNNNSVGSGDVAWRSTVTQLGASKASSNKASTGEHAKSVSSSPSPVKSASSPASVKESQPKTIVGGTSDVPPTSREDKSNSSSQVHSNSQPISGKEDVKSSTFGSVSVSKVSSTGSRHRKSMNGFPGASVTGVQKETGSSRSSSLQKSSPSEKLSGEKALDAPVVDGSSHKLIVKIPNRGRSPVQSTNGGSFEEPSIMSSRASSPVLSDKHDQLDHDMKCKNDAYRAKVTSDVNGESWQSNDVKEVLTGSNDGDGLPTSLPDEERVRTAEDVKKVAEPSKAAASSSGNELKSGKLYDAYFSSINALIESCVKYSEANTSMSVGDDIGMNLLASVAAGEISKSDLVSPRDSPQRSSPVAEEACTGDNARSKASTDDNPVQDGRQCNDDADGDDKKHDIASGTIWPKDEPCQDIHASPRCSGDRKTASSFTEEVLRVQSTKCSNSSLDLQTTGDRSVENNESLDEMKGVSCLPSTSITEKEKEGEQGQSLHEENAISSNVGNDGISDTKLGRDGPLGNEVDAKDVKQKVEVTPLSGSSEAEVKNDVSGEGLNAVGCMNKRSPPLVSDGEALSSPVAGKDLVSDNGVELKVGGVDKIGFRVLIGESGRKRHVQDPNDEKLFTTDSDQKRASLESSDDNNVVLESQPCPSAQSRSPAHISQDFQKHEGMDESKPVVAEGEERPSTLAGAASSYVAGAHDMESKVKFDLNEGFIVDDGKCGEPISATAPAFPSNIQVVNPLPLVASSVSTSLAAPVTVVAAAAKGSFVPPEDLLRSKAELGWKGSAATSAFRPAEPRKVVQMPLAAISVPASDASTSKHSRTPLDIDLNVPDERVLEDLASRDSASETCSSSHFRSSRDISQNELKGSATGRSSGGLDLDLNRTDEPSDMGQYPSSSNCRLPEAHVMPVKSLTPVGLPTSEVRRDFDLNDGPSMDDASTEQPSYAQHARATVHPLPSVAGLRVSNGEVGNFSPWFPPGSSYSTVTIPSILSDCVQQSFPIIPSGAPQRILTPAGSTPFTPDVYRGSVLSSSPTVPFPSSSFQYPAYPFGTAFPLPSATFSVGSTSYMDSSSGGRLFTPPLNTQLLGPVDVVPSQYPRPYVVSLPEGTSVSSAENSRKWGWQGFDLNAGPGAVEAEGREEILAMASTEPSGASSQSLAQEQGRIYPVGGGVLKRKEPDGGWDNESFRYKQSSWQ